MKIAFIGMGTMGGPMASLLAKAGYEVVVHNRTRSKEAEAIAAGATGAASPKEAAIGVDVVITNVSDSPDVYEVVYGENGAAHNMKEGSVLIDMSTISPQVTKEIAAKLAEQGCEMLDAPVSGGSEGAQKGTLSIMVGGKKEILDKMMPVLEVMGSTITYVGENGAGQVTKAINQIIIAGNYIAAAEGMALGLASGIDVEAALQAVSGGAAGSWVLTNRGMNMIKGEYPLGFRTRLHLKDLGIGLEAAKDAGVPVTVAAHVAQLEAALVKRGYGEEDVSNIARAVREASGIDS